MYYYIRNPQYDGNYLYTVGCDDSSGKWHPEGDYNREEDAGERVAYLNGGGQNRSSNFPPVAVPQTAFPLAWNDFVSIGLSKREYFVAATLQGLCANPQLITPSDLLADRTAVITEISHLAVEIADATIAKLSQ